MGFDLNKLTKKDIKEIIASGDVELIQLLTKYLTNPIYTWTPRPDKPALKDEQASFVNDKLQSVAVALGGTGCLGAEEEIYDPIAGKHRKINQIKTPFYVEAWDGEKVVIGLANRPYCKGIADLYRVHLSNGQSFVATLNHRVLTANARFYRIADATRLGSVLIGFQKASSCQDHCCLHCHQCDARPLRATNNDPTFPPLQGDAQKHNHHNLNKDDLLPCNKHNPFCHTSNLSDCEEVLNYFLDIIYELYQDDSLGLLQYQRHLSPSIQAALFYQHQFYSTSTYNASTVTIDKIEWVRRDKFYDFTVHKYHNYLHKGIVHHNSGKSAAAAYKTSRFLLETPAPRKLTPFIIASQDFRMAGALWLEKLSEFIPPDFIQSISWRERSRGHPEAVVLKPNLFGHNWVLDFRSYVQGREQFQAISAGGFWCDELAPWEIIEEIIARCRDYDYPSSKIYSLTPLAPAPELENLYNQGSNEDWKFYHLNTDCNTAISERWKKSFFDAIDNSMLETRRVGAFASFHGAVYPDFNNSVHVIQPIKLSDQWYRRRSIDFGYQHPTVCLWGAKDQHNNWYIYDEYSQSNLTAEQHVSNINAREAWNTKFHGATYADTQAAQERAEFHKLGLFTANAKKDIFAGIESVKRHLKVRSDGKPKLFIFNTCKNLIREMRTYRYHRSSDRGLNPKAAKDAPIKKDDDHVDALRYLIYSEDHEFDAKPYQDLPNLKRTRAPIVYGR